MFSVFCVFWCLFSCGERGEKKEKDHTTIIKEQPIPRLMERESVRKEGWEEGQ